MLSGLPPIATDARTSSIGSFVPIVLQKSVEGSSAMVIPFPIRARHVIGKSFECRPGPREPVAPDEAHRPAADILVDLA